MVQQWRTPEQVAAALARFEATLGWRRPVLHGIGFAVAGPPTAAGLPATGAAAGGGKAAFAPVVSPAAAAGVPATGGGEVAFAPVAGPAAAAGLPATGGGEVAFVRVNDREDLLAAAVLATVAGWHGAAGAVRIRKAQLAQAIELLSPAEAVTQPNLRVWRDLAGWDWQGATVLAVFDPDPDVPSSDPHVIALREVVASGRQAIPAGEVRAWPAGDHHPLFARWPELLPIGRQLKDTGRLVRFHSLPGAKRYPDTEAEYDTVLQRHDAVVGGLLGGATDLLVITLEVGFTPTPRHRTPLLERLLPGAEPWAVLSWPDLEPQLAFAHLYVSRLTWRPARLDPLLRAVADDEVDHVILAPPDLGWLYLPYDGGADAVLATPALRDEVRERHRRWAADIGGSWRRDG